MVGSKQGWFIWKISFIDLCVYFFKECEWMKGTYCLGPFSLNAELLSSITAVALYRFMDECLHGTVYISLYKPVKKEMISFWIILNLDKNSKPNRVEIKKDWP